MLQTKYRTMVCVHPRTGEIHQSPDYNGEHVSLYEMTKNNPEFKWVPVISFKASEEQL
jgi:hypothetical protein